MFERWHDTETAEGTETTEGSERLHNTDWLVIN